MQTIKPDGVYLIKDAQGEIVGLIVRDNKSGHKIVMKCEEYDLEALAELILTKKDERTV